MINLHAHAKKFGMYPHFSVSLLLVQRAKPFGEVKGEVAGGHSTEKVVRICPAVKTPFYTSPAAL